MRRITTKNNDANPELIRPDFELWSNRLNEFSLFNPEKIDIALRSFQEAQRLATSLPFSLAFCPADRKIENSTSSKIGFELIPLTKNLTRANRAIEELFGFLIFTKRTLGIIPHVSLVFADTVENGLEETTNNTRDMPEIATESVKGIQEMLFLFDQNHSGLLQREKIPMPKIHKMSVLAQQAQKFGPHRDQLISQREFDMLDPLNPLFEIWKKHLALSRHDNPFTVTSWRSKKTAEAIQGKIRFLLAQLMVDGEILPKLMKELNPKKFAAACPRPIFITSSIVKAGFEMEVDGFNAKESTCVIAPFHNIGNWTDSSSDSPWLNFLKREV